MPNHADSLDLMVSIVTRDHGEQLSRLYPQDHIPLHRLAETARRRRFLLRRQDRTGTQAQKPAANKDCAAYNTACAWRSLLENL